MLDIKDIKCFDGVTEFKDLYVYKLDKRATASINKVLGSTFKGVFRREDVYKNQLKSCDLNLDTGSMFLLKSCGEMVEVVTSEWCCFVTQ